MSTFDCFPLSFTADKFGNLHILVSHLLKHVLSEMAEGMKTTHYDAETLPVGKYATVTVTQGTN